MENKADKSAQAQEKMNRMKYEIANELGIDLKQGYNGDLTFSNDCLSATFSSSIVSSGR